MKKGNGCAVPFFAFASLSGQSCRRVGQLAALIDGGDQIELQQLRPAPGRVGKDAGVQIALQGVQGGGQLRRVEIRSVGGGGKDVMFGGIICGVSIQGLGKNHRIAEEGSGQYLAVSLGVGAVQPSAVQPIWIQRISAEE